MSNKYLERCQDETQSDCEYTPSSEGVLARIAIAQLAETIHEFSERETKAIEGWGSGLELAIETKFANEVSDRELALNAR
jgi:hypothetical protein